MSDSPDSTSMLPPLSPKDPSPLTSLPPLPSPPPNSNNEQQPKEEEKSINQERPHQHTEHVVSLGEDVLTHVLGDFLGWMEIWSCRSVSKLWKQAAEKAIIVDEVFVWSPAILKQLLSCSSKSKKAILQGVTSVRFDFSTAASETFDVTDEILHQTIGHHYWKQLKHLKCRQTTNLTHVAFQNTLLKCQSLVTLDLLGNTDMCWTLAELAKGLPHLQQLRCTNNKLATGDLKDLLPLDLTVLECSGCEQLTGNIMELATTMPHLQELSLDRTNVQGDLRELRKGHFPSLQELGMDHHIYGRGPLRCISHAPAIMAARYQLLKQSDADCPIYPIFLSLSKDSPDYYDRIDRFHISRYDPAFMIETLIVGDRIGWRWTNHLGGCCDIHWCDPEPTIEDKENLELYQEELEQFQNDFSIFKGFLEPPSQEEYHQLCRSKRRRMH